MKKFFLKRLLFIPLGIIAFILTKYAQLHPQWTENIYSLSIYPVLSSAVAFLPSLVRLSVIEWLAVAFLLLFLCYVIYYLHKIIKNNNKGMILYNFLAGIISAASILYFCFTALCGLNYHRYQFSHYTEYETAQYSTEELEQLCISLSHDLGRIRAQLGEYTDISRSKPGDFDSYATLSIQAIKKLSKQYPALNKPLYSTPKPVIMSKFMTQCGILGIFMPFTMESNINKDILLLELPSTMTHELAHQCGFMREDEANFIAYLACKQLEDPLMLYSGIFSAFYNSIHALNKIDPALSSEIIASLPKSVLSDWEQHKQFWAKQEGIISDISKEINNTYLKSNNQTDGIASYGKMVDLLLAEKRAEQLNNTR